MSEARSKKLASLTRSLKRGDFDAARKLIQPSRPPAVKRQNPADGLARPLGLEQAVGGYEQMVQWDGREGTYWLIRRTLEQIAPDMLESARRYGAVLAGARQRFDELEASPGLCVVADARPQDVLFLDLETCGLGGEAIFLVGLMVYHDGRLVFNQFFARDYAQEAAILLALADRLASASVLVTFNGKAFDLRQVQERSAVHRIVMSDGPGPRHLDLLPESRKRWRKDLPNCRLQTLERAVCGRLRMNDIPGWAIPDAYHAFVADGDARRIRDILHHNMLDLLTMADLLCALLSGDSPVSD